MGIILRAGGKLIATLVVTIALFVVSFMYFPAGAEYLSVAADFLVGLMGEPTFLGEGATALFAQYINESTLTGVLMAAIARILIETVSFLFGGLTGGR